MTRKALCLVSFAVIFGSAAAPAQSPGAGARFRSAGPPSPTLSARPEAWGTANTHFIRFGASEFQPTYQDGATKYSYYGAGRFQTGGYGDFAAPIHLPSGALILGTELTGVDLNLSGDLSARFIVGDVPNGEGTNYGGPYSQNAPGDVTIYDDLSGYNLVIDNAHHFYEIDVGFGAFANTLRLGSVAVYYKLQVSPAPASATFGDVPTNNPFFRAVEALGAAGITSGCGSGNFCPNYPVTRGELAKFLANALGLYWGD